MEVMGKGMWQKCCTKLQEVSFKKRPGGLGSHFSSQLDGWNGAYKAVRAAKRTGRHWTGHFNHIFHNRPRSHVLNLHLHRNPLLHSKTLDRGPGRTSPLGGKTCHRRKQPRWCRAREASSWEAQSVSSHMFMYKCTNRLGDCLLLPWQGPLHLPAPAPERNKKPWERCAGEDSLKLSGKWIETFMPLPVPKKIPSVFSL